MMALLWWLYTTSTISPDRIRTTTTKCWTLLWVALVHVYIVAAKNMLSNTIIIPEPENNASVTIRKENYLFLYITRFSCYFTTVGCFHVFLLQFIMSIRQIYSERKFYILKHITILSIVWKPLHGLSGILCLISASKYQQLPFPIINHGKATNYCCLWHCYYALTLESHILVITKCSRMKLNLTIYHQLLKFEIFLDYPRHR